MEIVYFLKMLENKQTKYSNKYCRIKKLNKVVLGD